MVHTQHQRHVGPRVRRELVEGHAGRQHMRQPAWVETTQVGRKLLRQRQSQPRCVDGSGDPLHAGGPAVM